MNLLLRDPEPLVVAGRCGAVLRPEDIMLPDLAGGRRMAGLHQQQDSGDHGCNTHTHNSVERGPHLGMLW